MPAASNHHAARLVFQSLSVLIADYTRVVGGMLDRPKVHRTACSGWASPHRAAQAGASACLRSSSVPQDRQRAGYRGAVAAERAV